MSIDLSSISELHLEPRHALNDESKGRSTGGGVTRPAATADRIYGRSGETLTLLTTYKELRQSRHATAVIVHGSSGCGKTALVETLRIPVFDSGGYFVTGKYTQNATVQEPYSAIMAAFSDLCDLTAQADDFTVERRYEMANVLKAHAPLLGKAITNLSSIVGGGGGDGGNSARKIETEASSSSSFAQFKVACKAFLRALATEKHPVVMFLDDVQWADDGSLELIQLFLRDTEFEDVMFILAYRDEEAEYVETVIHCTHNFIQITVSNLDAGAVHEVVASILGLLEEMDELEQFSDLIFRRTSGNPLHIGMLMETIQQDQFLTYNIADAKWRFDIEKVQQVVMVSDTLASLLARKIERLACDIVETLKVASLVGYCFDESVLLKVASTVLGRKQHSSSCTSVRTGDPSGTSDVFHCLVLAALSGAIDEGFIEKAGCGYHFTHDKVQTAFQALISDSEEIYLHQQIAEAFLDRGGEEKSNAYKAAVHLSYVPPGSPYDIRELAYIYLEAAKHCQEISAFDKAILALENGVKVLTGGHNWSTSEHSSLIIQLMEALARSQLIVGDFEACKQTVMKALCHATSSEMKLKFLLIEVEVLVAGNEVDAAFVTACRALRILGVTLPRKPNAAHVLAKLIKVKLMLRNKTDANILNRPVTNDPLTATAVKLLMHVCTYFLFLEKKEVPIFSALLATELTLIHGLSQHSPGAFAIYGVVEASLGNTDQAYRFGKLALAMLNEMEDSAADCSTMLYTLSNLSFWKEPLHELVDPLYRAANKGFQYGDIFYGTFCLAQTFTMQIQLGRHCASIENLMRIAYNKVSDLGQETVLLWLQPGFQYILNLQIDTDRLDDISVLTGEVMDEELYFRQTLGTNTSVLAMIASLWKARLALDFGQYGVAIEILKQSKKLGSDNAASTMGGPAYYWGQARAHYGMFELTGQSWYIRKARKYKRLLQRMDDKGCPAAAPLAVFLVVQEATLQKTRPADDATVRASYSHGINCLMKMEACHLRGLLCERANFDFIRRGLILEGERYFDQAMNIYKDEWGAVAKCKWLEQQRIKSMPGCAQATKAGIRADELCGTSIRISTNQ